MVLAYGSIFGHVAPGLAHEPNGRPLNRLSPAGTHENRIRRGHLSSNLAFFKLSKRNAYGRRGLSEAGRGSILLPAESFIYATTKSTPRIRSTNRNGRTGAMSLPRNQRQ